MPVRARLAIAVVRRLIWFLVVIALGVAGAAEALDLQPVLSGLSSPVYVTHARDGSGRLFIMERGGVIKVLQPGASVPTVFLDISARVIAGGEQGLVGLAFHPQYPLNGRFFVNYTILGGRGFPFGTTVIAEYSRSADPNVALSTERVVLTIDRPAGIHQAGMMEFGPDGMLYIAAGDSGAKDPLNLAQNLGALQGKILRIDVNSGVPYAIPSDNPFVSAAGARPEIWAYGLRNPFRFSFDRATGTLTSSDTGEDSFEEINVITRGANYGWRTFEGLQCTGFNPDRCNDPFTPPFSVYGTPGLRRCAVIGGYTYRGRAGALPAGTYIFGDFCSGEIFTPDANRAPSVLLDTTRMITSFGEDEAGELYVVGLGGTVDRLVAQAEIPPGTPPGTPLQNFITGLYVQVLGRAPGPGEVTPWADFLRAKCNVGGAQAVVQGFFGSTEFAARPLSPAAQVTVIYRAMLGRDPDPAGLAAWVDVLHRARLRLAVDGFLPSPEFRALMPDRSTRAPVEAMMTRFYTELLGRSPEAAGLEAWTNFIMATGTMEMAAAGFLTSPEFQQRALTPAAYVTALYRTFLGRQPDPAGLQAWQAVMQERLVDVIETGFLPAAEFNLAALCAR